MSIDCAFFGFLAADAEARTSQAGKPWVRMRVGAGKDEQIQWVAVAVFGKAAEAAGKLKKGDRCYIEGTITINTWKGNDGVERHGLNVAAFKCEQTHRIGRSRDKPKRDHTSSDRTDNTGQGQTPAAAGAPFADDIPFAPEWR
jgi:single-stranded DNA-binding protein